MYNNDKCCCLNNLEKDIKLKLSFENEIYSIYGDLNNGEKIIIKYHGKLVSQEDSDESKIFLNYGYGNLWIDKNVLEMNICSHSETKCYCIEIDLTHNENLFFCFMDNNNNWDLNDGTSYMIVISEPLTVLTKKNIEVIIPEYEYSSTTVKVFKRITEKLIHFFMRIGDLFDGKIKA